MPSTGSSVGDGDVDEAELGGRRGRAPGRTTSVAARGAVAGRVDVGAAGQQQPVEPAGVLGGIDVLGQVDGQPAGRGDRPGVVADVDVDVDVGEAGGEPGDVGAALAAAGQSDQRGVGRWRFGPNGHSDPNDIAADAGPAGREVFAWMHGPTCFHGHMSRRGGSATAHAGRARSWPTTSPSPCSGQRDPDDPPSCSACPAAACRSPRPSPTGSAAPLDVLTVRKIGAPAPRRAGHRRRRLRRPASCSTTS